jgi:hypothetical protein
MIFPSDDCCQSIYLCTIFLGVVDNKEHFDFLRKYVGC